MDRLTRRTENGVIIVDKTEYDPISGQIYGPIEKAVNKLADYEDTGLTPEEIERIKNNVQPM